MSTITKQIAAVEFQANAKQVNAALQSIQNDAVKAREKVEDLQRQLKQAEVKNLGAEAVEELRINLREATKDMRTFETAQQSLMKGVKAFDELWKNAKTGTIERLTAQQIQAGINAAKVQLGRLKADIPEDQAKRSAIFSMTDEARKVLSRMKLDTDNIIQVLERGGSVANDVLEREKRSLKEMLSLVDPLTDEWAQYNAQLTRISKGLQEQELAERRLRGEITDRQQAIRMANKEESDAVSDAIAAAKMRAEAAKQAKEEKMAEADAVRAEMNATQQNLEQVREEIRQKKEAARASAQATDAERTSSAELYKAKVEANKASREEQDAYKKQKKAVTELGGEVDSLRQKYEELRKKQQEMSAATIKPKVDSSEIERLQAELKEAQRVLGNASAFEKLAQAELDSSRSIMTENEARYNEKRKELTRFNDATYELHERKNQLELAIEPFSRRHRVGQNHFDIHDQEQLRVAAEKLDAAYKRFADDQYFKESPLWRQYELLGTSAFGHSDAEQQFGSYERAIRSLGIALEETGSKARLIFQGTGTDKSFQGVEFLDGYISRKKELVQLNADIKKALGDTDIDALAREVQNLGEILDGNKEKVKEQEEDVKRCAKLRQEYADNVADIENELAQAQRQSADAGQEKAQTDENLTKVQKEMAEAEEALRQKEQELAAGQQRLAEQSTKTINASQEARRATQEFQDAKEAEKTATENATSAKSKEAEEITQLRKKEQELTDTLNEQTDELTRNTEEANRLTREQIQSQQEADNLQNNSIEKKRQAIRLLEELNEQIADPGNEQWKENERAIGRLNEQLRQLKQESAELRGEMMSLADAELIANQAMTEQAMTTKTGWAAGVEELKQAETVLTNYLSKAKRGTAEEEAAYQRMVRQLQAIRTELGAGSVSGAKMMEVLSDPTSYKNIDTLKGAISRARNELNALGDRIDQAVADGNEAEVKRLSETYDDLAKRVKTADQYTKELANSSKGAATSFEKAWSRLKTYISLYVGAAVAMQKLTGTMGDMMELSDKMGEVRKTTGFTADEVGRLSKNLSRLDTRTSLTGLMELSATAGQLGLKTENDVRGFTEAANMLMVALPEMGREGATEMLKVALATGEIDRIGQKMRNGLIKGNDAVSVAMTKIGSTIDQLRANSAAAAPAITDFVKRVGAVGAQSGITIDQVAALGSTVDALGMRVEMSATALSRMIPAIRNNAFDIGKIIGKTQQEIEQMYSQGKAMDVFISVLESMKGKSAEDIEQAFGMGGMADIMKDLNQQGARAGIVFAGLSQNLGELRRQLAVAHTAYEENIAIQNEYNKMNDTTAAKWERLKNQIEELVVTDSMQRLLGYIISGLRTIADILTENSAISRFMRYSLVYLALLKAKWAETIGSMVMTIRKMAIETRASAAATAASTAATEANTAATAANAAASQTAAVATAKHAGAWGKMNAAMKANIITAVITAIVFLIHQMVEWHHQTMNAIEDMGRFNRQLNDEKNALDALFAPLMKSTTEQGERSRLISEINNKYSKYLGFMVSETATARELADAHALIAKRIREEAYEKRILDQETKIRDEYESDMNTAYGRLDQSVRRGIRTNGNAEDVTGVIKTIADRYAGKYTGNESGPEGDKIMRQFRQDLNGALDRMMADGKIQRNAYFGISKEAIAYMKVASEQQVAIRQATATTRADLRSLQENVKGDVNSVANDLVNDFRNFNRNYVEAPKENGTPAPSVLKEQKKGQKYGFRQQTLGWQMNGQDNVVAPMPSERPVVNTKNLDEVRRYVEMQDRLRGFLQANGKSINEQTRKTMEMYLDTQAEVEKMRNLLPKTDNGGGDGNSDSTSPYGNGTTDPTNYKDMTAELLVERRKQMKEYVNAIQTDSDIPAMLSKDPALKRAIEKGMASDMRTVIEWYNDERLKIQEALHERHLTNTGDWMDPKKGAKKASKMVQDEMKYYLDELDAYYTERKAMIQEERNDEEISEGEAWRRTLLNEAEWQQRRAELQQLYANKSVRVTEEEQNAIYDILSERTGDTMSFIRKDIEKTVRFIEQVGEKKGKEAMDKIYGDLDLGIEKAFLRRSNAVGKQVQFITDTLAKERPFNGITENLQENLTKMGILTGQVPEKMHFLLGQIEDAYTLDVKEMTRRISEAGFKEWADEISGDTQVQQALLAQLRQAYEAVQENIRKEASRIKKDADMMWKLAVMPDGTNLKQAADDALSMLALQQERVTKANQLIGAGPASDNVASRIAIKQLQLQLSMQQAQFALMRKMGKEKQDYLLQLAKQYEAEGQLEKAMRARTDAENVRKSVNIAITDETKKQEELNRQIANEQEEVQNRLYKDMKEYANLMYSGLQGMFEASNAGSANYYNEMAKMRLTGGGGGGGQYIVIDNAGTADAEAHYEMLSEQEALRRQMEIEQQNAMADALKKMMDEFNQKIAETITDQMNAMLQADATDMNTKATNTNTSALTALTDAINRIAQGGGNAPAADLSAGLSNTAEILAKGGSAGTAGAKESKKPSFEVGPLEHVGYGEEVPESIAAPQDNGGMPGLFDWNSQEEGPTWADVIQERMDLSQQATDDIIEQQQQQTKSQLENDKKQLVSTQSMYAKMTAAANLYGIAYQAMSNNNMTMAQKFGVIALQAVGNAAITALNVAMSQTTANTAADTPSVLSKAYAQLGPIGGPIAFGLFTGLLGGLMGLAAGAIGKGKSEIAQATGVSVGSGRMATGMLTYAEGNVNELTDPDTLTAGRSYNVDGADGKTYRARYMGKNPRTHITNGPEFHLVGEDGQEAIIDAKTTRQIRMDDNGIWRSIQTLYNGGRLSRIPGRRVGKGIPAFADGNIGDFQDYADYEEAGAAPFGAEQLAAFQTSLDRNNELLDRALTDGIRGVFSIYGKNGLIDSYDTGKRNINRYGQRF